MKFGSCCGASLSWGLVVLWTKQDILTGTGGVGPAERHGQLSFRKQQCFTHRTWQMPSISWICFSSRADRSNICQHLHFPWEKWAVRTSGTTAIPSHNWVVGFHLLLRFQSEEPATILSPRYFCSPWIITNLQISSPVSYRTVSVRLIRRPIEYLHYPSQMEARTPSTELVKICLFE